MSPKAPVVEQQPEFTITPPDDFILHRDVCSYGYFRLAPNDWHPDTCRLVRVLTLDSSALRVVIRQTPSAANPIRLAGRPLRVRPSRSLDSSEKRLVRHLLTRMLRLDESAHVLREFHALDPRWKSTGRGRIFRSPTLFEDIVKTITSCNVQWPGTVAMNAALCVEIGSSGAFPTPRQLAKASPARLRGRCRVGYRDTRLIQIADLFVQNAINESALADPMRPDDEVFKSLLELPGVGPYAAANIMQLMGRYSRLPLDTEAARHGRTVLGFKGTAAQIMKRVRAHYAPFGTHAFRSYWLELWTGYESLHGPAWTWPRKHPLPS
ncbi:MAG: hypothetical protein KF866_04725 [Phycisphaeraceae bacterium]|nr:hypothetical protein [Phycisphaeraceae bacterium]